jgi:hypothetical protein
MILAQANITGRIIHNKSGDPLGQWTYLQLAGCNRKVLNFITAYQVCPRPTIKTGTTAYHRQESLLQTQGQTDHNPCHNFRKDLTVLLKPMKHCNEHIILIGNFNEPLDNNSNMSKLYQDIGLMDVFSLHYPTLSEPATHICGSRQIEYFLVSASVLPTVEQCSYDLFQSRLTYVP